MNDFWKDMYYDCLNYDLNLKREIVKHQKAIQKCQEKIEENKNFFQKTFEISLDECLNEQYKYKF